MKTLLLFVLALGSVAPAWVEEANSNEIESEEVEVLATMPVEENKRWMYSVFTDEDDKITY